MAARLSALCASRTLPPGFFLFKDFWYSFLLEAELTPGPVRSEGLGQFKKSTSLGLASDILQHVVYEIEYSTEYRKHHTYAAT
jgi:hypothetical protein